MLRHPLYYDLTECEHEKRVERGEIVNPHVFPYEPAPQPDFEEMERRLRECCRRNDGK